MPQRRISQTEAGTKTWATGGEDKKCWAWCFADGPSSHCSNSPIGVDLDTPKLFSHAPPLITPPPRVLREWWCVFSQFSHKRWKMGPPDRKMKSPSIFRKGSRSAPYLYGANIVWGIAFPGPSGYAPKILEPCLQRPNRARAQIGRVPKSN